MADIIGFNTEERFPQYNVNVLDYKSSYNIYVPFAIIGGTGTIALSEDNAFTGRQSMKVDWLDMTTPFSFQADSDNVTIQRDGYYTFSHEIFEVSTNPVIPCGLVYRILVKKNGTDFKQFIWSNDASVDADFLRNQWNGRHQVMNLSEGDVITWAYELQSGNVLLGSVVHYFDGLRLEMADRRISSQPTIYTEPNNRLTTQLLINFPSTVSGAKSVITGLAFVGAVTYQHVTVTPTTTNQSLGTFRAWVEADGLISIEYTNTTGSTQDLANSAYTFKIYQ